MFGKPRTRRSQCTFIRGGGVQADADHFAVSVQHQVAVLGDGGLSLNNIWAGEIDRLSNMTQDSTQKRVSTCPDLDYPELIQRPVKVR